MRNTFTRGARGRIDNRPKFVRVYRDDDLECACGEFFPRARRDKLGMDFCLKCSPEQMKVANAPLHKQGYTFTSNIDTIKENQYAPH